MRELKADDQILGASVSLLVRVHEDLAKLCQTCFVLLYDDELIRIGASIGPHRHRLATVNQFRPAFTKLLPTPTHFIGNAAARRAVPTFHRLNRDAVPDGLAIDGD